MQTYTVVDDGYAYDVVAWSAHDCMRMVMLEDARDWDNTTYLTGYGELDPRCEWVNVCLMIIRARKARTQGHDSLLGYRYFDTFEKDEVPTLGHLQIFAKKDASYIIENMRDDDAAALFEYLYTGGYGDQYGVPAKEWHVIEVMQKKQATVCNIEKSPSLNAYRTDANK